MQKAVFPLACLVLGPDCLTGERNSFLRRPHQEAEENVPRAEPNLSSSNEFRDWPFYQSELLIPCAHCALLIPLAPHDFTLDKAEVIKRAAWSWYRTGLLIERSAEDLQNAGAEQEALGIRDLACFRSAFNQFVSLRLGANYSKPF